MRFGRSDWEEQGVNWDTEGALVLCADGKRAALIGFKPDWDMLVVQQLQGIGRTGNALSGIRWERLLVRLLVRLAQETGWYDEVCIAPASSLHWYRYPAGVRFLWATKTPEERAEALLEHQARLKRRYDGTARATDFEWDEHRDLWICKLKPG